MFEHKCKLVDHTHPGQQSWCLHMLTSSQHARNTLGTTKQQYQIVTCSNYTACSRQSAFFFFFFKLFVIDFPSNEATGKNQLNLIEIFIFLVSISFKSYVVYLIWYEVFLLSSRAVPWYFLLLTSLSFTLHELDLNCNCLYVVTRVG